MSDKTYTLHGVPVYEVAREGAPLKSDRDAVDILGAAFSHGRGVVVLPVERLGDDFFHLKTRIAGEILQKFIGYGYRVAIVGDIAHYVAESDALRDFVYESNRGRHVWFVQSLDELEARLAL
jgi:hypothetical protein